MGAISDLIHVVPGSVFCKISHVLFLTMILALWNYRG